MIGDTRESSSGTPSTNFRAAALAIWCLALHYDDFGYARDAGIVSSISVPESSLLQTVNFASGKFGAHLHAGQAIAPFTGAAIQNLRTNPFSIVRDAESKLTVVITDFDFNPSRAGVPEGVACGLAGDAVTLRPSGSSANLATLPPPQHESIRASEILFGRKPFSDCSEGTSEVVFDDCRRPHPPHRIPTLVDGRRPSSSQLRPSAISPTLLRGSLARLRRSIHEAWQLIPSAPNQSTEINLHSKCLARPTRWQRS